MHQLMVKKTQRMATWTVTKKKKQGGDKEDLRIFSPNNGDSVAERGNEGLYMALRNGGLHPAEKGQSFEGILKEK